MKRRQQQENPGYLISGVTVALILLAMLVGSCTAHAAPAMPHAASHYRADLTRIAHAEWGLDAPVAVFAAQIHQESAWRPQAVSRVGAVGMAQFMPATARWWCGRLGLAAIECQPTNPHWAMRSLVGYDRWLYARVNGDSEFDLVWAALRSYNGGLGHWLNEARNAGSYQRAAVDRACGSARRAAVHCRENLGYPRRILLTLQPLYTAWGGEVAP
ncbi:MAG: lytic transglycosylase domain-containing protein [Methylomonas sp.]|jgi:soluble lytic murein transglycosylase-like protein|uniref:transglycosylase SLT domain-containing protein n=1 Tax=Methylomonas sp. TaxID=418 RepID=UPI0025CF53F0|nr:lytic transglycosylase domain-containing protein [Methylomonas sp.]MCK9606228.1 lytic transglycosylase domain-containing protein [Methylomonas sp.]